MSKIVRQRWNNKCAYCGSTENLQCSHILPREDLRNRWELSNAVCLCSRHHKFDALWSFHRNPGAFFQWLYYQYRRIWNDMIINLLKPKDEIQTAKEAYDRLREVANDG